MSLDAVFPHPGKRELLEIGEIDKNMRTPQKSGYFPLCVGVFFLFSGGSLLNCQDHCSVFIDRCAVVRLGSIEYTIRYIRSPSVTHTHYHAHPLSRTAAVTGVTDLAHYTDWY